MGACMQACVCVIKKAWFHSNSLPVSKYIFLYLYFKKFSLYLLSSQLTKKRVCKNYNYIKNANNKKQQWKVKKEKNYIKYSSLPSFPRYITTKYRWNEYHWLWYSFHLYFISYGKFIKQIYNSQINIALNPAI